MFSVLQLMTHDPNVLNALNFSLDGRFFNYVLTVVCFFGTLFVSVLCVFCPFEKTRRSSAVHFWSISRDHVLRHLIKASFVTRS